jgi:large subunit ribosomal protein L31e
MVKETTKKSKAAVEETVEEEPVEEIIAEQPLAVSEQAKPEEALATEEAPVEEAEEKKEVKPKKKKKEDEIVEERTYTIPLGRALNRPPKRRAPRAIVLIKEFIIRHMKMDMKIPEEEDEEMPQLNISKEVNEKIWDRGIEKPPRKIRVRAAKNKAGNVTVYLAEEA